MPELEAAVRPDYPPRGCPRRARSNQVPQAVAKLPSRVVGDCPVPAVASEQILHSFHEILRANASRLASTNDQGSLHCPTVASEPRGPPLR